jgi:fructokinase
MEQILCIGEALIDMICTDKGSTLSAGQHFLKKPGGAPTNVAAAIAALGGKVSLIAKVGKDPFGTQLIEVMQDFGVNTKWMLRDEHHFTTLAFVSLMENGERDFVFSRGADGQLSTQDIKAIDVNEFGIVHFGSATGFLPGPLQDAYSALLKQALKAGRFISFDPNYRHLLFKDNIDSFVQHSWYFLEACDFFKVSDEEALLLTQANSVAEAANIFLQRTNAVFAITLGKEGTLMGYQNQTIQIPSIAIQPVDTTGAGDAFVGAVLYQLSRHNIAEMKSLSKESWESYMQQGNKAGARTCEYMGAMEAFKFLSNDIFN